MILYNPISDEIFSMIKHYTQDVNLDIKKVYVYIDIQNFNTAVSDIGVENYVNSVGFDQVFNEILFMVNRILVEFWKVGFECHVFIYTDIKRNIFNTNLINSWKENRKKSFSELKENEILSHDAQKFMNSMLKHSLKALKHLVNYSRNMTICILENIDSDFVPRIVKEFVIDRTDILHLILSSDHDYTHLINDPYTIRYSNIYKRYYKNFPSLETIYNKNIFLKKKEDIKTDEDAIKVANYYQIFHALGGDSSDDVKPMIPRTGLKKWAKKVSFDKPVDEIIDLILDNNYTFENVNQMDLIRRLLIVDFRLTAYLIFNSINPNEKYNKVFSILNKVCPQNCEVIRQNANIVKSTIMKPRELVVFNAISGRFKIRGDYLDKLWITEPFKYIDSIINRQQ
jgi:hypothetical protein